VPWLKTLDSSVAGVNQGGRRQGACAVYLEPWHADIEEFLELRENTGDSARRTYNLNLANWIPDLFMKRVKEDGMWSLFDPKEASLLVDCYGTKFEELYTTLEQTDVVKKQVKARDLYAKMMRCLAQTGVGWMNFKDAVNTKSNQTHPGDASTSPEVIHNSNLCTEIAEVSSSDETAVCNLGSINLAQHFRPDGSLDLVMIRDTARQAVMHLDRVIDLNLYSIPSAKTSNNRWRPIGLGLMGLQDVFFKLHLDFTDTDARRLSRQIQEHIYFAALEQSCDLAEQFGAHPSFPQTKAAKGELQFDLWGVPPSADLDWARLKGRIKAHGLRNSLVIAIAPTATIASIAGCYECIEPQVSNLFKRETLSGDFLQVNKYLVDELRRVGLWNEETRNTIKHAEGSVKTLAGLSEEARMRFRTAWELPMKALIDMAAERGAFIDQSQSLNLFMATPSIGALSSMYMYAWEKGIKTTYYLRSRPATKIAKTTVEVKPVSDVDAVVCSLENPEACEACQ
jgi:ribonucleoside-diphosphate reductase alpha chain